MRPANGALRRFKLEPKFEHKRSEGNRSVRKHPTSRLIKETK